MRRRPHRRCESRCSDDAGTGLIGAAFGVFAMLAFLLFAMQLLMALYTTSVVQTVAFDAARAAATDAPGTNTGVHTLGSDSTDNELFSIEERARDALGPIGEDARFTWEADNQSITLEISVNGPSVLPAALSSNWSSIKRRAVVRHEQLVDVER